MVPTGLLLGKWRALLLGTRRVSFLAAAVVGGPSSYPEVGY